MKKLALLTLSTLGLLVATASAQNLICDPYFLTNIPPIMPAGAYSNVTTLPITVRNNYGLSIYSTWACTTNTVGTAGLVMLFQVSVDATNYTTTFPFKVVSVPNGVAGVRDYTNFPATLLNDAAKLKLVAVTNGTADILYITNICVGRGR